MSIKEIKNMGWSLFSSLFYNRHYAENSSTQKARAIRLFGGKVNAITQHLDASGQTSMLTGDARSRYKAAKQTVRMFKRASPERQAALAMSLWSAIERVIERPEMRPCLGSSYTLRKEVWAKHVLDGLPYTVTESGQIVPNACMVHSDRLGLIFLGDPDLVYIEELNDYARLNELRSYLSNDGVERRHLSAWVEANCVVATREYHGWVERTLYEENLTTYDQEAYNRENPVAIGNYHYAKNVVQFIAPDEGDTDDLHMGLELEMVCPDQPTESTRQNRALRLTKALRKQADSFHYAQAENDRSVGEYGFEVVTGWTTMGKHKAIWDGVFADHARLTEARSPLGRLGTSRHCGLHIHVSRSTLTSEDIGNLFYMITNVDNARLIAAVAGRYNTDYTRCNRLDQDAVLNYFKYGRDLDYMVQDYAGSRYAALNVTGSETIEFRIFQGTVEQEALYRAIEFTHAMVNYVKGQRGLTVSVDGFVEWLASQSGYSTLKGCFQAWAANPEPLLMGVRDTVRTSSAPWNNFEQTLAQFFPANPEVALAG